MPKTTNKTRNDNLVILSPDELKEVIELLTAIQEGFAGGTSTKDRRYHAKLERIKGKLRRGF